MLNARPNLRATGGLQNHDSALHLAARLGFTNIIRLLLNAGANVNGTDSKGIYGCYPSYRSPLFTAAQFDHLEAVNEFLDRGANIEFQCTIENMTISTDMGPAPLHGAAGNGHLAVANALVQRDANINLMDDIHGTPLHYAAVYGQIEMFKQLLNDSRTIHLSNTFGRTPLAEAFHSFRHTSSALDKLCELIQIYEENLLSIDSDTLLLITKAATATYFAQILKATPKAPIHDLLVRAMNDNTLKLTEEQRKQLAELVSLAQPDMTASLPPVPITPLQDANKISARKKSTENKPAKSEEKATNESNPRPQRERHAPMRYGFN